MNTLSKAIGLAAFVLSSLSSGAALSSTLTHYDCSVAGGFNMTVTVDGGNARAMLHDPFGGHRMTASGGGVVRGTRADGTPVAFDEGRQVLFVESERFNCRMMVADNELDRGRNETLNINHQGYSLGGKLRDGPGTGFRQVGSLVEGTGITILTNTGVRVDGYDWFEIVTAAGARGYQWGGIMCSNGSRLDGIYATCAQQRRAGGASRLNVGGGGRGWLVFAIGSNGAWGHGAAPTRQAARNFAVSNCGGSNCVVEAETQSQCQALATAPGGFWFGDAPTEARARSNAMGFCQRRAGNCRVEYSYCQ